MLALDPLLLIGQSSFPGMVRPIDLASIHLSLKEAAVNVGYEVQMLVDNNKHSILRCLLAIHDRL